MLARLARDLPRFLRHPLTPDQAAVLVGTRLERRAQHLLALAEATECNHRSPYRWLLRTAGCELGDVRALVGREGVDGALTHLAEIGVSVSFDEFKGRSPIVRGSARLEPAQADFDNPDWPHHFEHQT